MHVNDDSKQLVTSMCTTCRRLTFMVLQVVSLDKMVDMLSDVKLQPTKILVAICGLLQTLMSLNKAIKEKDVTHSISSGFSEKVWCIDLQY